MKAKVIAGAVAVSALLLLVMLARLGPWRLGLLLAGLLALYLGLRFAWWALIPRSELPRNRIRDQRNRLYLRLHPGRGHATWWELHGQWSRTAAYRRVRQVRS